MVMKFFLNFHVHVSYFKVELTMWQKVNYVHSVLVSSDLKGGGG